MRDVFKYFKHVRSLQESKGAEKAAELGYQHQARGVYIDPKTQKKYKNVGDKLEPIIDEPAATKPGAATERPEKKSLGQFTQDATGGAEQAAKRGDIDPNNIEGGIPDPKKVEILAKGMSGGRWNTLSSERRETLMQAATEKLAQIQMQQAAAVEPEPEPEPEPQPEPVEEPAKAPEDFPTLDDKIKEVEDEEDDMPPELTGLLDSIRSGDSAKEKKTLDKLRKKESPKPQPAPAIKSSGKSDTKGEAVLNTVIDNLSGNLKNAKSRELNERLADPTVRKVASEFIQSYVDLYSEENMKAFEEGSNFSDIDGARSFMEGQLGMVRDKKGKLAFGDNTPGMRIAMGDSPGEGQNFREYRGLTYHEKKALQDPEVRDTLDNIIGGTAQPEITYNDRRNFQKGYLKNNISYEDTRTLYEEMDRSIQNYLNGLGQPENAMGIFDPKPGTELEYFEDKGKMSGDTNLDMMMNDPETREEFLDNFSTNRPGKERGIMVLQRLMNTGFKDQATGIPLHGGIRGVTADHIVGRRSVTGDPLDYPLNLALVSRNLNQFKSGNSEKYGDDTFNKVVNSPDNNPFKNSFEGASGEGLENDPEFLSWVANRLTDAHFDPKRLKKVMGESGGDKKTFVENTNEIATMSSGDLETYMKRGGADSPLGLNLANLTKLVPRPQGKGEQGISKNSWRGTSGVGYSGTEFLNGYRKTMLSTVVNSPELNTEIETIRKSMQGKGDDKINEAIRRARTSYAERTIKVPMQGISSIYSLGRLDNKDYVNWFRKKGEENLENIKKQNPELHKQLSEEMNSGLDDWEKKLDKIANGPRPFDHGKDNPKVLKAINDEWGKQIMKSKEARSYLTEEELNAFYGSIKDPEKWAKPMGESLTKTNGRVMMERLKKSLRDPLNGKTSI